MCVSIEPLIGTLDMPGNIASPLQPNLLCVMAVRIVFCGCLQFCIPAILLSLLLGLFALFLCNCKSGFPGQLWMR